MEKMKVQLIIEIMGRPAEHIKEALNTLVVRLGSEKGVNVLEKTYHEPMLIKESNDLFTAFAEVTAELETIENYLGILFAYMPSHIEIINPSKVTFPNYDLTELGNKIVQRLHEYDAITKNMITERNILAHHLQNENPELFKKLTTPPEKNPPEQKLPNSKSKKPKKP